MIRIDETYIENLKQNPPSKDLITRLGEMALLDGVSYNSIHNFMDQSWMTALWLPDMFLDELFTFLEYSEDDISNVVVECRRDDSQSKLQMELIRNRMAELGEKDKDKYSKFIFDDPHLIDLKYEIENSYSIFYVGINRPSFSNKDQRDKYVGLIYIENLLNPLNQYVVVADEIYREEERSFVELSYFENGLLSDNGKLAFKSGIHTNIDHFKILAEIQSVVEFIKKRDFKDAPSYSELHQLLRGEDIPLEEIKRM